ncbi:GDSL esterase/lipase At1g29670-like [Telopea speciosissima]|uniref:GDSL esterase/lipase At1g29670-like n=1 Tax=Telopea speciosissima TaxID=54955 RepID=UPI001CC674A3|nr:GDSL esterase/lipase At1g29670-like [Telopea speciosissima]
MKHQISCSNPASKEIEPDTNGMFVFGSSLVDNGNNNFLMDKTNSVDYLPYGIDFPLGPSGRYTNGKNVIDELGELLKLPFIPPFKHPTTKGHNILHGVNFASGGSGILDDTGTPGTVITMRQQVKNFEKDTLSQLGHQLGHTSTNSLISSGILSKYLFVIGVGGNDYLLNYLKSNHPGLISFEAFTANMTMELSNELKMGCFLPLNKAVSLYNSHLKFLVDVLKPKMPGSNLVYVNSYDIISDIIKNPNPRGFNDIRNACCELNESGVLCKRGGKACGDRNSHVFFDGLHPTEAVNKLIAKSAYDSSSSVETYPMNVQALAKL